jgi:hypothetical protein
LLHAAPARDLTADAGNMTLSAEKNLAVLRRVLAETPGATLAFVGDGPERAMLEEHLAGLPVTFMVRRRRQGRVSGHRIA